MPNLARFSAYGAPNAADGAGLLVVAVVLVVIVAKERRILAAAEVLFEAAFALWVDVTFASEEREQHGEEYEGVSGGP